jgi:hypothetical protein
MDVAGLLTFVRDAFLPKRKSELSSLDLQRVLDGVPAERETARQAIATAQARRRELVISGAGLAAIKACEAEEGEALLQIERLDYVEETLNAQIAAVRTSERAAEYKKLVAELELNSAEYLRRARAANAAGRAVVGQFERIQAAGFREIERVERVPAVFDGSFIISADVLSRYENEANNFFRMTLDGRAPERALPAQIVKPLASPATRAKPVQLPPPAAPARSAPRVWKESEILADADGNIEIEILRMHRFEGDDGVLGPGRHRVPREVGLKILRTGMANLFFEDAKS